jgi:hypothetical protein
MKELAMSKTMRNGERQEKDYGISWQSSAIQRNLTVIVAICMSMIDLEGTLELSIRL